MQCLFVWKARFCASLYRASMTTRLPRSPLDKLALSLSLRGHRGSDEDSAHVAPVEDNFARVAGAHGVEALLVVAPVHAVGDDAGDVETTLKHDRHLVPGLVHLAAVDAADGELVEDDLVPVDGDVFGGDAEHGDLCAVAHVCEHLAEGAGVAGHFEADVEAFVHLELLLDLF